MSPTPDSIIDPTAVLLTPTASGGMTMAEPSPKTQPHAGGRIHRFAAVVHQAIDKLEKGLSPKEGNGSSKRATYGEQARDYGEKLRGHINARPLQSAGIAVGAGVILNKAFSRTPSVRVVQVPAQTRPAPDSIRSSTPVGRRWSDTAGAHLRETRNLGHEAFGKVGAAAGAGVAGTRAMASSLARGLGSLQGDVRSGAQRLLANSQSYTRKARTGVQAHPMVGLGAMATGGALLTTAWLQRRRTPNNTPYTAVDEKGKGLAWQRDQGEGALGMINARPVTSAMLMLGVGALIGATLKR